MTARASESCAVGGWEKWHDWQAEPMRPVVDWYCTAIGARPGMRVLDAACGTGDLTDAFCEAMQRIWFEQNFARELRNGLRRGRIRRGVRKQNGSNDAGRRGQ